MPITIPSGVRRLAASLIPAITTALVLAGGVPSPARAASPTSALGRWKDADTFLASRTTPTEIVCIWTRDHGKELAPRPARFYSFADRPAWSGHTWTRFDRLPRGTVETCEATVPTSVPYGPAIETFLAQYGLVFGARPGQAPGLDSIEIAYAGQNREDPDIIYRHEPGLFGLRMALGPIEKVAFRPGTSRLIQPRDNAMARRYLRYAAPLLRWYGYAA